MHYDCLIVDDERELADLTCEYFEMFDVKCHAIYSAKDCLDFLDANSVDVLLLDINLEDGSGFNVCKTIRETSDIPIIFISARQSDDDILIALNIGGDDYVKKPYALSVLLAKVKVTLKRVENIRLSLEAKASEDSRDAGAISIDSTTMKIKVCGKDIALKAKEFKLLNYLYNKKNTIVSKDELLINVWGDTFFSDGTLNVHIRRLREKIEEDPNNPKYIKTIWGTGYMLEL